MNCPRCSVPVPGPGLCPWCGYDIQQPAPEPAAVPSGMHQAPPAENPWQHWPPPWPAGPPQSVTWKGSEDGFPHAGPGALASPWRRLAARILDFLLFVPVFLLALVPTIADLLPEYRRIFDLPTDQQEAEIRRVTEAALDDRLLVIITAVTLAMFVYEVAMLAWRGATVGKLLVHVRVVPLAARTAVPPIGVALVRTGLPTAAGFVPVIGSLLQAADVLWCLFDRRRQCLHDKIAGTVVVNTR